MAWSHGMTATDRSWRNSNVPAMNALDPGQVKTTWILGSLATRGSMSKRRVAEVTLWTTARIVRWLLTVRHRGAPGPIGTRTHVEPVATTAQPT